jgi:hypothetical protein
MDEQERERFKRALERKHEDAEKKADLNQPHAGEPVSESVGGSQESLASPGREQDTFSVRAKNSGHGKKTADKWNQ